MKIKFNSKGRYGFHDPELEEIIRKKDAELKELARKNGKYFGAKNLPAQGDDYNSYTGDIRGYFTHIDPSVSLQIDPHE
jgi:hypothetical protein